MHKDGHIISGNSIPANAEHKRGQREDFLIQSRARINTLRERIEKEQDEERISALCGELEQTIHEHREEYDRLTSEVYADAKPMRDDFSREVHRTIAAVVGCLERHLYEKYHSESECLPRSAYDILVTGLREINRLSLETYEYASGDAE